MGDKTFYIHWTTGGGTDPRLLYHNVWSPIEHRLKFVSGIADGKLCLADVGHWGVICSCHNVHMSVSKFTQVGIWHLQSSKLWLVLHVLLIWGFGGSVCLNGDYTLELIKWRSYIGACPFDFWCVCNAGTLSVLNPSEAVLMENGENLVQWRKLFFCQYEVSMKHATFSMCLTTLTFLL
jgi:hypothetical protein